MLLYLFRHGIAENAAPGGADSARPLTLKGLEKLKYQAAVLGRSGLQIERLYSSPYVRARQTADMLSTALRLPVEEQALLSSGCTFDDLMELFKREGTGSGVLIVGHQPDLGEIVRVLTGSTIRVSTGAMAVVDVARLRRNGGMLRGLYDPDVMAELGRAILDLMHPGST
jgi:phosphohistidine phosphatase